MALKMRYTKKIIYHADDYLSCVDAGKSNEIIVDGITCDNAYVRVENVNSGKYEATARVKVYQDNTCNKCISDQNYSFIPLVNDDAPNIIKQGYEYLKSLPEYVDSIDC